MRIIRSINVLGVSLLLVAGPASAQAPPDFGVEFDGQFNASARKLVSLAEAMPAETYTWSPSEGVASVAEVYMHIARYNYMYPETAMGIASPMGSEVYDRWEDEVRDKEEVLEILSASMDHVRMVAEGMTTSEMDKMTRLYGRDVGEWAVLLQLITHMNEHLGQSIAYARMNSVVPPWSM